MRRLCLVLFAGRCLAATVSGVVYLDQNANGQREQGEPGVAGAVVATETLLTTSDATGAWRLAVEAGPQVVFVVNPAGTWPTGAWWVPLADGAAGGSLSFGLRRDQQDGPFLFAHGTDIHLHPPAVEPFRRYVEHLNRQPVRFVVHTGDQLRDVTHLDAPAGAALYDLYEQEAAAIRAPLRNLAGNHEHLAVVNPALAETVPGYGKALYRQRCGPMTYAFDYGRAHFLALDGTLVQGRQTVYGLTAESAAWAARYLAGVPAEEPVVLLVHEPLGNGADTAVLRQALSGHKLVATLCGHGHNRGGGPWAGAPQIMGGAVSYAWHGWLEFPPQPWGYALYRLDGDQLEGIFLDWAEERSIDVTQPGFGAVWSRTPLIRGQVSDLAGDLKTVRLAVGAVQAEATVTRTSPLATAFAGQLDVSLLPDGVHELVVTASDGTRTWTEQYPVVVLTGRAEPFTAPGPGKLTLLVDGVAGAGNQVLLNGEPLADVPATPARQALILDLPAARLRRLNPITIRAADRGGATDKLQISRLALACGEVTRVDVRYPYGAPRGLSGRPAEHTAYVDLAYAGVRATVR